MDELSEADKQVVKRARRIKKFLSQSFSVAEKFTGNKGQYVKIEDTIRSFKEILTGKYDDYPEDAFSYVGTIEDMIQKAKEMGYKE